MTYFYIFYINILCHPEERSDEDDKKVKGRLMKLVPDWIKAAGDALSISDFSRDAEIVRHHLGAELTRAQFDQYCGTLLLRKVFYNKNTLKYFCYDTSMQSAQAEIMRDMMFELYRAKVVLPLESNDGAFREKLTQAIHAFATQRFSWLLIPQEYENDPSIKECQSNIIHTFPYLAQKPRFFTLRNELEASGLAPNVK